MEVLPNLRNILTLLPFLSGIEAGCDASRGKRMIGALCPVPLTFLVVY